MRPTWAEINISSLKSNLEVVKDLIGSNVSVLAVVKADAYGHGAVKVSKALVEAGVEMLGVATLEEGLELRESGVLVPIIILGGIQKEETEAVIKSNAVATVICSSSLKHMSNAARKLGKDFKFHLKLDTGMGRLGVKEEDLECFLNDFKSFRNLEMEGIFTHLACADEMDENFTLKQINKFNELVKSVKAIGIYPKYIHLANSAAIQRFSQSHGNMVRPGIMLYGTGSFNGNKLFQVMTLKSRIIQIKNHPKGTPISYGGTFVTKRQSVIATVPVGYADGYLRKVSNKALVSINGKTAPVVGTVCMDFIMIDVTDIKDVNVDDKVILFGDEIVSIDDVAGWAETIPYEIMTILGKRVPRVFV